MPRRKADPIDGDVARLIGGLLKDLRKAAGYRAARDAASAAGSPAATQSIYAYERGGLVPTLKHFMELIEFYCLQTPGATDEVRYQGVAAMMAALSTPAYGFTQAMDLINRLQPKPLIGRRRRSGN